jgi:Na+/phosphate symporter
MEERELLQRFHEVLEASLPVIENAYKGFITQKPALLKESKEKFKTILASRLSYAEKIVGDKEKDAVEKKFVTLLTPFQTVGIAIQNVISNMEIKVEANVLFSQKGLDEIKELLTASHELVRDIRDYTVTKNPHLLTKIKECKERIIRMIDEFAAIHQNRLITGVCMPKASYLYLDITDSIKRIARGLVDFAEKV